MLHPAQRHLAFVHHFVDAVAWQPLRQALARPSARTSLPLAAYPIPDSQLLPEMIPSPRAA